MADFVNCYKATISLSSTQKKERDWSKFKKHETLTVRIWHFEMIIVAVEFLKVSQIGCYVWSNVIVIINEKESWILFDQYKVEPLYTMIIFWSKLILNIWGSTSYFLQTIWEVCGCTQARQHKLAIYLFLLLEHSFGNLDLLRTGPTHPTIFL